MSAPEQDVTSKVTSATSADTRYHDRSMSGEASIPDSSPPDQSHDKGRSTPANIVNHTSDSFDEEKGELSKPMHWKGWAELENDPLIFTKLLKEWGVPNIKVDEVIPLDTILEKPADSVVGLIFLSRWTAPEQDESPQPPPDYLWFANQISTYSCATLALMNIINNVQHIDLGANIEEFKESTALMNPKDRGLALDQFEFVRDIHNAFSRDLDHMIVDLKLKEDYQAANRRRAPTKKKKKRRKRTKELLDDDEDGGFHFVAYVASRGDVWKLDGLETTPRHLGSYQGDENWLMSTISDIQMQLDGPDANAMEFSLLSLTREDGTTIASEDESKVERMKEDWSPFFAHMLKLHAEKGDLQDIVSW